MRVSGTVMGGRPRFLPMMRSMVGICATATLTATGFGGGELADIVKNGAKQLPAISYCLRGTEEVPKEYRGEYLLKFWANNEKFRAEKYRVENGVEVPLYIEAFDGSIYQNLDFSTGELRVSKELLPKVPNFPKSFHDNVPLQLLGFLNFDKTLLPNELQAGSLADSFSFERWKSFFEKAKPMGDGPGERRYRIDSVMENGKAVGPWANYTVVTFSDDG